jgi:lipoprotein NlpD
MVRKIYFVFWGGLFLASCMPKESLILSPGHLIAERGDTVYSIAQEHHVPVRDLIRVNRLQPPYSIQEGQVLTLPEANTETPSFVPEPDGDTTSAPTQNLAPFPAEKREGPCLLDSELTTQSNGTFNPPVAPSVQEEYTCPPPPAASQKAETLAGKSHKNTRLIEESSICFDRPPSPQKTGNKGSASERGSGNRMLTKNNKEQAHSAQQPQNISFSMPSKGEIVLKYGESLADGKKSRGILIKGTGKKMICASAAGEVLFVGHELNGKNVVIIKHPGGWMSAYLPLRTVCVKAHQPVVEGQKIGFLQGEELHFEIRKNRVHVNPLAHMKGS